MTTSVWQTLGVPQGSSRDEIRRAYARELRQTSPEDDPVGFQHLRQAYERALQLADRRPVQAPVGLAAESGRRLAPKPEGSPHQDAAPVPSPDVPPVVQTPQPAPRPSRPPRREMERLADSVKQAIRSKEPEKFDEAPGALQAFLTHSDMENLEIRGSAETWLIRLLLSHSPKSDPLLQPAIDFFKWDQNSYKRHNDISSIIKLNADYYKSLMALKALKRKSSPVHAGWKILTATGQSEFTRNFHALRPDIFSQIEEIFRLANDSFVISGEIPPEAASWWRAKLATKPSEAVIANILIFSLQFGLLIMASSFIPPMVGVILALGLGVGAALLDELVLRPRIIVLKSKLADSWTWAVVSISSLFLPAACMLIPKEPTGGAALFGLFLFSTVWTRANPPDPIAFKDRRRRSARSLWRAAFIGAAIVPFVFASPMAIPIELSAVLTLRNVWPLNNRNSALETGKFSPNEARYFPLITLLAALGLRFATPYDPILRPYRDVVFILLALGAIRLKKIDAGFERLLPTLAVVFLFTLGSVWFNEIRTVYDLLAPQAAPSEQPPPVAPPPLAPGAGVVAQPGPAPPRPLHSLIVYSCRVLPSHVISRCGIVSETPRLPKEFEAAARRKGENLQAPAGARPIGSTVFYRLRARLTYRPAA